tara:strand:+ start:1067 stop:1534 length:468 start_codon:yes stop_codon:yes gene_type:complete
MKFHIIAIEGKRPLWAKSAFEEYQERFDQSIQIKWSGIKPDRNTRFLDKKKRISSEGKKLLKAVKKDTTIIALNKEGESWTTLKLKDKFNQWLASSKDVSFLIGGPEGLSEDCLYSSNEIWSLSPLTFPHSIVPIILIEQLYRVWSIEKNHPYHK